MGKIMLNGVDYSAPVGGGSGESTEQIKEISERVKILEVKVPFGFSTTSVGAYGYLDLEGNFHEFGSGEQSEFIEGIKGEYSQTSKVLAFKDASTNVNMLYARGGVEINGTGTNVSIAAASGSIAAGQYSNTKYININNSTQIKVPASASEIEIPFSFGIDSNGNYGYIKAGADTVTPFKSNDGINAQLFKAYRTSETFETNISIFEYEEKVTGWPMILTTERYDATNSEEIDYWINAQTSVQSIMVYPDLDLTNEIKEMLGLRGVDVTVKKSNTATQVNQFRYMSSIGAMFGVLNGNNWKIFDPLSFFRLSIMLK